MDKIIICITGNTATGTTTLTKRLNQLVGWKAIYSEDYLNKSPFYSLFLQQPEHWGFHNQVFFITEYVEAYLSAITQLSDRNVHNITCFDYSIWELAIYTNALKARGFITPEEYDVLTKLFQLLQSSLPIPNLIIYVTANINSMVERIQTRGRSVEVKNGIDSTYLENLQQCFVEFVSAWTKCPVIEINSEKIDVFDDNTIKQIAAQALHNLPNNDC